MSPDSVNIRQAEESQQKLRQKILNSLNETCFSLEGCDYSGTHLPPEIGQLQNLQTLNLSLYSLTHLPPEIGQLQNLQTLNLSLNELTHLPPEIGQLQNLQTLNLSLYSLTHLPPEIGQLQNLQTLNLSLSSLTHLPPEIGQLQNLQTLNLMSLSRLTHLPPEIGQLQNLQTLKVDGDGTSGSSLAHLPPEIGQLQNLQTLRIHWIRLTHLPPEIGQLQNLQTLDLSMNNLTHLPPEIGQLQNLQTLDLNRNRLTHLPPEIGQLQNLQTLELYHNRELAHLPVEIGQIKQLTWLGLSTTACKDLSPLANHPNPKLRIKWGCELYLDRRYWTHPSQLKVKWLLSEKNIKVREQLIERIGFDRVCQELEAEIRHLLIQRIGFDGILKEMQAGAISTQELSSVPQAKFSEDGFDSWIEEARQKTLNSFNAMSSKNLGWVSLSWDIQVRPSEISDAVGQATLVYPDTGKILRLEWKNNENEGHEGEKVTFFYDDRPLILNHVRDTYHLSYSGDETTTHKEELDVPNLPCYQLVQGILCNQPWVYNFIEDDKTNTKSLRLSKGESSHFRSTSVSQTTISYRFDLTTLQCTYTYYSYTDICP